VKADELAKGEEVQSEEAKDEEAKEEQSSDSTSDEKHEAKNAEAAQHRDLTHMLSNLKLSSLNNSVVGISHETQHLLENFTVVLKDVVNGGPEAYHDLDKLLTERGEQLDSLFGSMPPFLQTLVKALPVKMYGAMAPQVAAAMSSEVKDASATEIASDEEAEVTVSTSSEKDTKKKKHGVVPSVQSLIKEQGTVAAMLRSILNFLQARFPLFVTGSNVLMSVAVFILLFVFWYCHKRGKQVRLSKKTTEKIAAESSLDDLEKQVPQPEKDAATKVQAGEREKDEAAAVPLPQGDASETERSSGSTEQPAKKEESTTSAKDVKSAPKKPEAEPAPKTSADDATLQKLLNLQQKAVDEAHLVEDAASAADKIEDDASAATATSGAAKPTSKQDLAPPRADESVEKSTAQESQSEQDYKPSMAPVVVTYDAKNDSGDKENTKAEAENAGSKISFGDLLKALEAHAKSAA